MRIIMYRNKATSEIGNFLTKSQGINKLWRQLFQVQICLKGMPLKII